MIWLLDNPFESESKIIWVKTFFALILGLLMISVGVFLMFRGALIFGMSL